VCSQTFAPGTAVQVRPSGIEGSRFDSRSGCEQRDGVYPARYIGCTLSTTRMARPFRLVPLLAAAVALLVSTPHAQEPRVISADALKPQIEHALAAAPLNFERLLPPSQTGVRLLGVQVRDTSPTSERIEIDLSQRALTYEPSGNIEPLLDTIIQATASTVGAKPLVEYRFTIDGLPLEQFLPRAPARTSRSARSLGEGETILVSPGHGLYWDEALGTWHLQRPRVRGIVEDLVNWDIARYLRDELLAASISALMVRYPQQDDVAGQSGSTRWQEAAKYFIQMLGAPAEIWNFGVNDYARDINSRPFYANWIDAAAIVAVHNNGGQETGTETWYDLTNGYQEESRRLAEIVNRHVVSSIRQRYDASWVDRGLRTCDGCKGENRLASRPAVIVEIAYMDMAAPDNAALHDETFKQLAARAIREAIQEWAER
jgi:N-acetylmuramoyl-L-alanine amidase